eukprot:17438-Pelagomonas_calceolata.AAC.6
MMLVDCTCIFMLATDGRAASAATAHAWLHGSCSATLHDTSMPVGLASQATRLKLVSLQQSRTGRH